MKKAEMEIDFLGMEKMNAYSTLGQGTSSSRGFHKYSLPNLNTRLERTGAVSASPHDPRPAAEQSRRFLSPTPVGSPPSRSAAGSSPSAAAPLTIFYNGVVTTFNLPRDKAEAIIEWAERSTSRARPIEQPTLAFTGGGGGGQQQQPPPPLARANSEEVVQICLNLPLARKRSLQSFLEKRKER